MAAYFILRDPRDVVVSHVHYVTEMEPNHIHHRYYSQELHTFDERLRASILGIPDPAIPFPDIRQRFLPYLGWLDAPRSADLALRRLPGRPPGGAGAGFRPRRAARLPGALPIVTKPSGC